MKNKRYKREAKRMYSACKENAFCSIGDMKLCNFYDRCKEITLTEPCNMQIRQLELLCKSN